MRILLVEDNPANIALFEAALEFDGHEVIVERDGTQGHRRALTGSFDLLLLDEQLPGMSGSQICAALRSVGMTLPIVALTAAALSEQVEAGLRAGFTAYLTKPLPPRVLRETVRRLGSAAP